MRIYANCDEMYEEEKRNLHEMGTVVHPQTMQDKFVGDDPAFRTLELSPCTFTILDPSDRLAWLGKLGKNVAWLREDFLERISSYTSETVINPGHAWRMRRDTWEPFMHGDPPRFAYTYSERLGLNDALARVVEQLRQNPDTRQAVIPIFSAPLDMQNLGGAARVPCSMHYQLMQREGRLRMMYVMRSCDFKEHFPYDIAMAAELQAWVAREIGIQPERLTFFAGSLHMYQKDAEVVF